MTTIHELQRDVRARTPDRLLRHFDPLTGSYDREHLPEIISRYWRHWQLGSTACLLVSVDNWDEIRGDGRMTRAAVTRQVAATVRRIAGPSAFLVRYDDSTYCALIPETGPELAQAIAHSVRRSVATTHTLVQGHVVSSTVSVGVAVTAASSDVVSFRIVDDAEAALRQARAQRQRALRIAS